MLVGIGQIEFLTGDFDRNASSIIDAIDEARARGCRLVVFPEFAVPGPLAGDLIRRPGFVDACEDAVERIRQASRSLAVIVGSIGCSNDGTLRNRAIVIDDTTVVSRVDAAYVPPDGVLAGRRHFTPSPGTETFDLGSRHLGVLLGEAIGSEDQPVDVLSSLGAEWIVQVAASPFRIGTDSIRRRAGASCAREAGLPFLYVNGVGGIDRLVFDGGSFCVDPDGRLAVRAPRFTTGLTVFDIDRLSPIEPPEPNRLAEIRAAIVLGVRDYVRHNGFDKVVVGLSGGIDSSLVAALAVEALGAGSVCGVYLPCAHSSSTSASHAHTLASRLGIELLEISAEGVHAALREALPFDARGVVDENLQARARAMLWMALANERNALVLATGNKSESAVGYSTLYGDITGALAPIADLYKPDVYRLAETFASRIPRAILERPPSAELRPNHRDEDDLPPYDVLDPLLEALIDQNASRTDLIERGFDEHLVDDIVERFYTSEFKRAQSPLGLTLTDHPLGARRVPLTHAYRE